MNQERSKGQRVNKEKEFTRRRACRLSAILFVLLSSCFRASRSASLCATRVASEMTGSGRSARRARSSPRLLLVVEVEMRKRMMNHSDQGVRAFRR